MRFVQITDLHIGREGEDTYGIDVRSNFFKILQRIRELRPSHLILTGDLCYKAPEQVVYQWINEELRRLDIPFELLSGNHDDPRMMAESFACERLLKGGELYFSKRIGSRQFLFLDTTSGTVSGEQLSWLKAELDQLETDGVLFMHHPPLLAGVPYMDGQHALRNRKALQDVFLNFGRPITVFCGHYHVEKTIRVNNLLVHITPSCFFQIDQHSEAFKIDHHRIGLREIVIDDGLIMHTVHYL